MIKPLRRTCLILAAVAACALARADSPPPPKVLAAPADPTRQKVLYTVGYAHLDTQWRWAYPQVIQDFIRNTLHANFALMEKYPDYVFNFSGSRRYEFMQEYYPEDFETLRHYVATGQWFPCGSSVDEADSIVPSAESLVRQVLYGNHYFRREFGVASDEFMLPDCFGFPSSLPTILAHTGVKGFSTQKLTWNSANGIPFKVGVWVGPDGQGVVAALDPGAYTGKLTEDLSHSDSWLARINHTGEVSGAFLDYHYYGTGDQGGAPDEKSVEWIEKSIKGDGPVKVVAGTADQMVKDLGANERAKLPTYKGELLLIQHSAGSISSEAYMKRWNRKNELLADAAEKAAVTAQWLSTAAYPSDRLYQAWDLVLGSQMHDMLPGTSLPRAYEFCWNDESLAQNEFKSVLSDSLGALSQRLDTRTDGIPLVVYNPLSIDREDPVEAQVEFPESAPDAVRVIDAEGKRIPCQVIGRDGRKVTILILAKVPSVGFVVYSVHAAKHPPAGTGSLKVSQTSLENDRYVVTLNAAGDIQAIHDKLTQREVISAPLTLAFQFEKPLIYPAWNMDWEDQRMPPRGYVSGPASVRIVEAGPVRVALEITRQAEGSTFVQTVRLSSGSAAGRIEFATRIDWQSRECALKAVFPMGVSNPQATYDSQVGTVLRGNNEPTKYEVPQHQWFDLTAPDKSYGVAVLNDSKFGSDKPDDRTLRLTLLYTPGVRDRTQDQGSQDQGRHQILYALAAHEGDWRSGDVPLQAARLNQPLIAYQTVSHPGDRGRSLSLFRTSSSQVLATALKKAEDDDSFVVRLRELTGSPATGIRLGFASPVASALVVDGQERELAPATVAQGEIVTDVKPYSLTAFKLRLAPVPATSAAASSQPVPLTGALEASTPRGKAGPGFDSSGASYPSEVLPGSLAADGISFALARTQAGTPGAVPCTGQSLELPAGDYDRVYLLAASADADQTGEFRSGDSTRRLSVPEWTGFVGQWDTRLWKGTVPKMAQAWLNELDGLVPAYEKDAEVVWFSSHSRDAAGADRYYQYSYLFKFSLPLTPGARTLTLPNNPRIRLFAVSVARGTHDAGTLVSPVIETFSDHQLDAPRFSPLGGSYSDTTLVTILHPTYWKDGCVHYTLDGTDPTASSPVYTGALALSQHTVVKARTIEGKQMGPVATSEYVVQDRTAPQVVRATALSTSASVRLAFSEPVDKTSAEDPSHYRLPGGAFPAKATASTDGMTVTLGLGKVPGGSPLALVVAGVKDRSPAANVMAPQSLVVTPDAAVLSVPAAHCPAEARDITIPAPGTAWSLSFLVKTDKAIANRTLVAGFGDPMTDSQAASRYIAKTSTGITFYSQKRERPSDIPFEVGKWQLVTATYDGRTLTLYRNGRKIMDSGFTLEPAQAVFRIAPLDPWDKMRRFEGELRDITLWDHVLTPQAVELLWDSQSETP